MNKQKNADMPAMPIEFSGFGQFAPEAYIGITKREMFAMAAMQGMLASETENYNYRGAKGLTSMAAEYADELLAELERTK